MPAASTFAWGLVILATTGLGVGLVLTDALGLFDQRTTILLVSESGCGLRSVGAPADVPSDALRHVVVVQAGEVFDLPAPPGEGTVRYEIRAGEVGVQRAYAEDDPRAQRDTGFGGTLGGCSGVEPGAGLGPFRAEHAGRLVAYAWRVPTPAG